jgi:rhodanese-related sulfurtransferase
MMKRFALALTILFVSGSSFAGTAEKSTAQCKSEEHYPLITKAELQKAIDAKTAFIVDVNSSESFKEHHVPTAIHFGSTKNFAKALPADKNEMIVAYCGGPQCTAWKKAAEQACKLGYTNIHHFKDGISGWIKP